MEISYCLDPFKNLFNFKNNKRLMFCLFDMLDKTRVLVLSVLEDVSSILSNLQQHMPVRSGKP